VTETNPPRTLDALVDEIRASAGAAGRELCLMEVCGTHTMAIFRHGIRELLPESLALLSGPGCPVCVTPGGLIDAAIGLARGKRALVASFGDMLRVPGSTGSLEMARAEGGAVATVYSPLDALRLARENPSREVVFVAVGFETTAPGVAVAVRRAREEGLANFSILPGHKIIPPALRALLSGEAPKLDGFLLPGHVSVVLGRRAYDFLAEDFGVPAAVAGFEPRDILQAIALLAGDLAAGRVRVTNAYPRAVTEEGNLEARAALDEVFEPCDTEWRGLGTIPASGLALREAYTSLDAVRRFGVSLASAPEPAGCLCGEVLKGRVRPSGCALFGTRCRPEHPVGPCMVSSEGTCAAHFKYGKIRQRKTGIGGAGNHEQKSVQRADPSRARRGRHARPRARGEGLPPRV